MIGVYAAAVDTLFKRAIIPPPLSAVHYHIPLLYICRDDIVFTPVSFITLSLSTLW